MGEPFLDRGVRKLAGSRAFVTSTHSLTHYFNNNNSDNDCPHTLIWVWNTGVRTHQTSYTPCSLGSPSQSPHALRSLPVFVVCAVALWVDAAAPPAIGRGGVLAVRALLGGAAVQA